LRSQRDLFVRRDHFAPGTASQYSNTNYIELGLLIGQGTHLSVEQAFQRYLWMPLDMDQTSLPSRADTTILTRSRAATRSFQG
jgi:CubicO group peptidase (beta-lactamase class C family)